MMIFMDENGNPTGPPNGWTDNGSGNVLSPVKGGPWGIPPPQSSNGNTNGLGLGMVGQSMRPPSSLGDVPQAYNSFTQLQNQNGGSGMAGQAPNPNMISGGGMLSAMPGYEQPTGNMQLGQPRPPPPGGWADPYGLNQQQQMMGRPMPMPPQMAQMAQMGGPQTAGPRMMAPPAAMAGSTGPVSAAKDGDGWWDKFTGALPDIGTGLAAGVSINGALKAASNTTATGHAMQDYLTSLGGDLNDGAQFQGYGVSTGMGNGSVGYQPQKNPDGSAVVDSNGNPVMGVQTNLGLDDATKKQIKFMTDASSGNFTDAANAYSAMNMVNSGQSAADYNAASQSLQTGASGITPGQGAVGGQAGDAAIRAMADPSQRQGEIYQQMMAMQNPELNRQQGEQQAQEYARGRGGVRGSQYGGTAEDAAMARARANASNQASLNAMQQADSERSMFGQMASQFGQLGNQNYSNMANYKNQMNNSAAAFGGLGNQADSNAIQKMGMLGNMGNQLAQLGQQNYQNSYMPMQQQIEAMKLGMGNADMAQTGQLTGQDYLAQLGLGGANANINAQHSANQLTGNLYNALLSNVGGTQGSDGTAGSGLMGILGEGLGSLGTLLGFGKDEEGGTG